MWSADSISRDPILRGVQLYFGQIRSPKPSVCFTSDFEWSVFDGIRRFKPPDFSSWGFIEVSELSGDFAQLN